MCGICACFFSSEEVWPLCLKVTSLYSQSKWWRCGLSLRQSQRNHCDLQYVPVCNQKEVWLMNLLVTRHITSVMSALVKETWYLCLSAPLIKRGWSAVVKKVQPSFFQMLYFLERALDSHWLNSKQKIHGNNITVIKSPAQSPKITCTDAFVS